jgi:hypothetical protein
MVRLVITDFATKEDNEAFYINDEFDTIQNIFTYDSFKKYGVFLSRYEANNEVYSLNLLSKKHLGKNQFLLHIAEGEYIILFNHKTVYSAKINSNFITDDMIKSILITKHIAMLSSGGSIDKIYYVINSKYKSAVENILKQNTKNEKNEVVAQPLGEIRDLIKPLTPLDTLNGHIFKNTYSLVFVAGILWMMFYGLDFFTEKLFYKESLETLKRELNIENRLAKRQQILLDKSLKNYKELTDCITPSDGVKK